MSDFLGSSLDFLLVRFGFFSFDLGMPYHGSSMDAINLYSGIVQNGGMMHLEAHVSNEYEYR
ncbi:hypothetical protein PAHAL_6G002800 [Panicum hallii]|uniref:Uncharacterized protein n=1 Tax=Panicum hallii TaxID=206008 RepID=A0A2S3I049_9POAL|nr:hypothetical protein PAHAL_6G002800 [Panicum hallii]